VVFEDKLSLLVEVLACDIGGHKSKTGSWRS